MAGQRSLAKESMTVRFGSVPAGHGYRWIFDLATY